LPLLPILRGVGNAAVLRSLPLTDRNAGRVYQNSFADPLAASIVRHWNRGTDRRIRGGDCRSRLFVDANESGHGGAVFRDSTLLSIDLPSCGCRHEAATFLDGWHSSSHGNRSVGRDVCDLAESAARWTAGRRSHRIRPFAATPPDHLAINHPGFDSVVISLGGLVAMGSASPNHRHEAPDCSKMPPTNPKPP